MLARTIRNKAISSHRAAAFLVAFLPLLLLPPSAGAQSWMWTTETVDSSGRYTSLAVDARGNLHLSYVSDGNRVRYAFRPADSSRWFTMDIDAAGKARHLDTSLALDAQGNPHVCYTPGVIKYARWDGQKWHIQQIAPGTGSMEFACAIAVAADGTPHVAWYQSKNHDGSDSAHIRYAVFREGTWLVRTIDFAPQTGQWISMALDSEGNPHLTYDALKRGQLKYARWDGKQWQVLVVDGRSFRNTESRGMGNSLIVGPAGKALISYYAESELKYARQTNGTWTIEKVDTVFPKGDWAAFRSSQALDRRGFPHLVYEDAGVLKHAHWDGAQWQIQTLAPKGLEPYLYSDIAIGGDDRLYVSFQDPQDGSLRVGIGQGTATQQSASAESRKD